jgi:hypothetical protein
VAFVILKSNMMSALEGGKEGGREGERKDEVMLH